MSRGRPGSGAEVSVIQLKSRGFCVTYDFSSLYTTLPHNLIKKLLDLMERAFRKIFKNEGTL